MTKIEHCNITVPNIDEAVKFIQIVAPDFKVRKDETPFSSNRWAHIPVIIQDAKFSKS